MSRNQDRSVSLMGTATEPGPTGLRLGKNLRTVRGQTSVRELSARLRELGRPLLPSAISKIENGARRVDVDELLALSVALDCTPNRLLIGPEADSEQITLTAGQIQSPAVSGTLETNPTARDAWKWARGVEPLDVGIFVTNTDEEETAAYGALAERRRRFQRENQPDDVPDQTDYSSLPVSQRAALDAFASAAIGPLMKAREAGLRWKTIIRYLRLETDQTIYLKAMEAEQEKSRREEEK